MVRRREFLRAAALTSVGVAASGAGRLPAAAAKDGKNVILIMADDVAYDCFGSYGSEHFSTPRLDQLAATGVQFEQCYSQPLCTPSRVKIMTGRSGVRNYVQFGTLDPKEITFGSMMKQAGYATAVTGKWQLHYGGIGCAAPDCDFDTWCLWNYPGSLGNRYWKPAINRDGKLMSVTGDSYGPDLCTDFILEFIEKNKARPFFVYYPMIFVHSPFPPTPDSANRKSKDTASNFRDMVAYMDKCIGRIVDALDKAGLREKTVLLYTTDNGTHRSLKYPFKGEQRKGEKGVASDGGSHAPLIVNCPSTVPAGKVCNDLVDFSDFLPTVADIAGAKLPDVTLDGRSFWPQCRGEKGTPREWIYQYYFPKSAIGGQGAKREIIWAQDHQYKLYADGRFYDVVKDRHEAHAIAAGEGSPEAEQARAKLRKAIDSMPAKGEKLKSARAPKTSGKPKTKGAGKKRKNK